VALLVGCGVHYTIYANQLGNFDAVHIGALYTADGWPEHLYWETQQGRWALRLVDVLFALPFIVLVIIFSLSVEEPARRLTQWVSGMTGWSVEMVSPMTGLIPLFIAIGALGWLTLARIVRTQTMELKGQEFVEAARSLGIGHMKILFRHIAPNLFGAVIVYTTLAVPGIMLLEAVLSFLGLGVKAPNSSWGTLIKEGADRMEVSPELLLFPALLFSATLLALNFLGDGLRDALDPKSSRD